MALNRRKSEEPRQLGRPSAKDYRRLEAAMILAVGGIVAYSITRGTPVYVGLPSTTGLIKIKFYHDDGAAEGHFGPGHFCTEGITGGLSDLFGEDVTVEDVTKVAPWFAAAVAEASEALNTNHAGVKAVDIPQKPAR